MTTVFACAVLLWAGLGPCADLYRWVDENGVTHWTDHPPDGETSKGKDVRVLRVREEPAPAAAEEKRNEFSVPFRKEHGGMLVDVLINDRVGAKMLVDTGATVVKVNVGLLKRLNQPLPSQQEKYKVMTAAGVVDARQFLIEKIDLGGRRKVTSRQVLRTRS